MKKIAIIGASRLQNPLILKANELGLETHVFAWKSGDVGEATAYKFYPISITEKDKILQKCKEIGIDGVCTIASDLANITVNYIARNLGLTCNSKECIELSTNKYKMRKAFLQSGCPSPRFKLASLNTPIEEFKEMKFPLIVKPIDRSGSRGIQKINSIDAANNAIKDALRVSFTDKILVEEFFEGREFSVEHISWEGSHYFLSITEKFTTGSPNFIERGHLEPARITKEEKMKIQAVVTKALDSLKIRNGASHSELKINNQGEVAIIEIGSRMGGDFIGSNLVELSTGYDFLKAVIDVSLGNPPALPTHFRQDFALSRFIFDAADKHSLKEAEQDKNIILYDSYCSESFKKPIEDSSSRHGFFIIKAENESDITKYIPS